MRNNRGVVLAALRQDADAYQYVGESLRNDPEVLRLVRGTVRGGSHLASLSPESLHAGIDQAKTSTEATTGLFAADQTYRDGSVDLTKVQALLSILRQRKKEGIEFAKPDSASLHGGTCSAMSFTFAHELLSRGNAKTLAGLEAALESLSANESVKGCVTQSCPDLRNLQMAFNAIRISPQHKTQNLDFSKLKIESLAQAYQLSIGATSESCTIRAGDAPSKFKEQIQKLPEGVYLLRALNTSDNEKLENFGHSLVFFKGTDFIGLYDPSVGMKIAQPQQLDAFIQDTVLFSLRRYSLDTARFYELLSST